MFLVILRNFNFSLQKKDKIGKQLWKKRIFDEKKDFKIVLGDFEKSEVEYGKKEVIANKCQKKSF